ncbi:tryptophan synthase beta subunit-like PLP-dependent enzyme [Diaporthe sp. PMI_573]|nr:tryptophan synthase beta subunit-like PLP-dependent enzyme [Diaporthaceae sp. PMI_573]
MGSVSKHPPRPWIETPCVYSAPLSRVAGCNIYLKLENLQPSGSFKSRGIGNLMVRAVESTKSPSTSAEDVHFYSSSGGNAGLACATAAAALGRPATVIVPMITSQLMIGKLRELGADVVQIGENWAAADRHLREVAIPKFESAHPGSRAVYVPPFDHQEVWDGNATLVDELKAQMSESFDEQIDAVICNVGGGGLLCGIMQGVQKLKDSGYGSPKVVAVETEGGDSFNASVKAGELVTLPGITTIATSLGATRVAEQAFAWVEKAGGDLISAVVTDKDAVDAMVKFLDHARILVESACSATIATVYKGDLRKYLGKGLSDEEWARKNVVVVVCGGSNINLEMLEKYRKQFGV